MALVHLLRQSRFCWSCVRRTFIALGCLGFPGAASAAANIVNQTWQLRVGDDPQWTSPVYPVSGWREYNLGVSSEHQCLGGETFWLRQTFRVPDAWAGDDLNCELRIRSRDLELYLNGVRLALKRNSDHVASFIVAARLLRGQGQENHLTLRISGHEYTGGAGTDFFTLRPNQRTAPSADLKIGFEAEDHVFKSTTGIQFKVHGSIEGAATSTGLLRIRIENEFHRVVFVREQPATFAEQPSRCSCDVPVLSPGFYQVVASFSAPQIETQDIQWFAVDPTDIHCPQTAPADLADYWKRAKAELAAVKPEFSVQREDARCTKERDVFTVSMKSVGGVTLRAWYIVPAKPGRYPAVLHVPGYGQAFRPEQFMKDGDIAHLALDVRGHGRSAEEVHPGFGTPGYVADGILDPERYIYRGAYLDALRALDFLCSRAEIDPARIGVAGARQGGGLAVATAALADGRVKCCVTGVPFLGDFLHHQEIRTVYISELEEPLKAGGKGSYSDVVRTMSYVDIINLAPWVKCPVLMASGLFDDDCPPHINFAVYNHLGGPKDYVIYPNGWHYVGPKWEPTSNAWLHRQLRSDASRTP